MTDVQLRRPRRGRGGERPMVPDAEFTSYYGRPVVKAAPWTSDIPAYLFLSGPEPPCHAAADFNGDGVLDLSDAVGIAYYKFQPELPDRPPGGWPGPALGTECLSIVPDPGLGCELPNPSCE